MERIYPEWILVYVSPTWEAGAVANVPFLRSCNIATAIDDWLDYVKKEWGLNLYENMLTLC